MTDFPSIELSGEKPIVYVRSVEVASLPKPLQDQAGDMDQIFAIHDQNGAVLALVDDRKTAFRMARANAMAPVSVH